MENSKNGDTSIIIQIDKDKCNNTKVIISSELINQLIKNFIEKYQSKRKIELTLVLDKQKKWKDRRTTVNKKLWENLKNIAKENKISLTIIVDIILAEFLNTIE